MYMLVHDGQQQKKFLMDAKQRQMEHSDIDDQVVQFKKALMSQMKLRDSGSKFNYADLITYKVPDNFEDHYGDRRTHLWPQNGPKSHMLNPKTQYGPGAEGQYRPQAEMDAPGAEVTDPRRAGQQEQLQANLSELASPDHNFGTQENEILSQLATISSSEWSEHEAVRTESKLDQ